MGLSLKDIFNSSISGKASNATTSDYPTGFTIRKTTSTWGHQAVNGAVLSTWATSTSNGGEISFLREDKSVSGGGNDVVSVKIDGLFYQREGNNRVLDTSDLSGQWTGSAAKLTTKRTMITNLASTTVNSFDGSGNIEIGIKNTLAVGHGGTGATTLTADRVLTGNGTSAVNSGNKIIAKTVTCHLGTAPKEGWRRVCKVDEISHYSSAIVFLGGEWSNSAPTQATLEISLYQNASRVKVIDCANLGYVRKIRLVLIGGGAYWLDIYCSGMSATARVGDVDLNFIGTVAISDIVTTDPNPVFTDTVTSNSECTIRTTVDTPTFTIQDSPAAHSGAAATFNGNNIALKMPATIRTAVNTGTYIKGNKGEDVALDLSAAGSNYKTIFKVNSNNGVFTMTGYGANLLIGYTLNTTITAGTNKLDKTLTLLGENGNSSFPRNSNSFRFLGCYHYNKF